MNMKKEKMNLIDRIQSPTPKIFRTLRTAGLIMIATGGTIIASPIAIPAALITIAGYITVAGSVMTAISQVAVEDE